MYDDKLSPIKILINCSATELAPGVSMMCTASNQLYETTVNVATVNGTAPDGTIVDDWDTATVGVGIIPT